MSWVPEFLILIASGVAVAGIVTATRAIWVRRRVPTALSQAVTRRHYVEQILALSAQPAVTSKGLEVRVSPSFSSENLSYHIFGGEQIASTVVNQQSDDRVKPALLDGVGPLDVFRNHFATTWEAATPLESVIAEQAILRAGPDASVPAVSQALRDRCILYQLDGTVRAAVAQHAAFRHSSSIIFIVGLPGSGKSFTRRNLAERLGALRIQTQELTDYVFAYRDFLHGSIRLAPPRGAGFQTDQAGAFKVPTEDYLRPALNSLAARVLSSVGSQEVTLVEFARSRARARAARCRARRGGHVPVPGAGGDERPGRCRRPVREGLGSAGGPGRGLADRQAGGARGRGQRRRRRRSRPGAVRADRRPEDRPHSAAAARAGHALRRHRLHRRAHDRRAHGGEGPLDARAGMVVPLDGHDDAWPPAGFPRAVSAYRPMAVDCRAAVGRMRGLTRLAPGDPVRELLKASRE
jgi:hypothetical protein